MPTHLLAIETATDACSVALAIDGEILEKFSVIPREHAHKILGMLQELCAEANVVFSQIDGIAFGCGPGTFTGLRIAASVTQGLAVAWDKPVVPISTLHALAQGAHRQFAAPQILSCLDARMNEVYAGYYSFCEQKKQMINLSEDFLTHPLHLNFPNHLPWLGVGSGCAIYLNILEQKNGFIQNQSAIDYYPHAYDIAMLAIPCFEAKKYVSAQDALPVYLRNKVTQ